MFNNSTKTRNQPIVPLLLTGNWGVDGIKKLFVFEEKT